jgi:hypothetical protein
MKYTLIASITVLMLAAFPADARTKGPVEESRELAPRMITMPLTLDGTLAVQGCTACQRDVYKLNPGVQFFQGKVEVSFADFKHFLASHPDAFVLLVTLPGQNVVTRLMAQ